MSLCVCGSGIAAESCCEPVLADVRAATTALSLMRARYSAYVLRNIDFIMNTTYPRSREDSDIEAMRSWAENSQWLGLEILGTERGLVGDQHGKVEFKARYSMHNVPYLHHEMADFVFEDSQWYFKDADIRFSGPAEKPKPVVNTVKLGRNDPCHCGSGKKFKKCCGA